MNFMKIILHILAIFAVGALSAQSLAEPFSSAEPSRSTITPYGRTIDAQSGNPAQSNYVAKMAEWVISEDGREYSSSFAVPVWWLNRQIFVRVGRSTSSYEVLVDDKLVGSAASGATSVEFNITKLAKEGRHTLKVRQTDAEQNSVNALIQQGVKPAVSNIEVICQPALYVRDILCSTTINNRGEGVAEFGLVVKCGTLNPKRARIGYVLNLNDTTVLTRGYKDVALDMRREDTIRFMAIVPQNSLWSINNPHSLTLDIESRVDNRPVECIRQKVGVRAADVADKRFYLNYQALDLKLKNYNPSQTLAEQISADANGVVIPVYYATEQLLEQCDKAGVLVFIESAINTLPLAESIRRGGNPSNDPFWLETYLSYNRAAYYTTHHHPCVVGYAIAAGKTNGINIYESYLLLKKTEKRLPIIYEGAGGEWCSDEIQIR